LELGFFEHDAGSRDVDLRAVYRELDEEPMGEEARRLRTRHDIGVPLSERLGQDPEGLVPLLHDIGYRDRLLTVTPLIILAILATVIFGPRPWRGAGLDFMKFDFGAVTFLGLLAVGCLALIMPAASGIAAWLAHATRFGKVAGYYADVVGIRTKEDAVSVKSGNWHVPEEVLFSAPRYWGDLRATSLQTDFYERLIVVSILGIFGSAIAVALAMSSSDSFVDWVPWFGLLVALVVALGVLVSRRRGHAAAVPALVAECYGVQPDDSID
jgi:hypothetical protein